MLTGMFMASDLYGDSRQARCSEAESSLAWREKWRRDRELAHEPVRDCWTIRRQPSSEMEQRGIGLGMARKVEGGNRNDRCKRSRHK